MIEHLQQRLRTNKSVEFSVRVRPHAARSEITGVLDDGSVKIGIAAPAEDGKGNDELIKFLAEEFKVGRAHVEILSGQTNRRKLVRITS